MAGFFDGEGCVYIHPSGKRYHCRVMVVQTGNLAPLELIQKTFGGAIHGGQGPKKRGSQLQMSGYAAVTFLRAIRPYLIIKAEAADKFIKMYDEEE